MGVFLPDDGSAAPESLEAYRLRGGYGGYARARRLESEALIAEIEAAGLRGRGGAGFPTGTKWRMVAAGPLPHHLVVNGAEGEPGSMKDRTLMARAPHRVLEGILIAARALQAERVQFYLNDEFVDAIAALTGAWRECEQAGLADVDLQFVPETHVYIAGEETALLSVLMLEAAQPWHKPPYPSEKGLDGEPTAVNNVETLAAVALIMERGADVFAAERPMLFSLSGDVRRPGVYEAPEGISLATLLERAGGPLAGQHIAAVLPGGYSMPPITADRLAVPLSPDHLRQLGTGLGASLIAVGSERGFGQLGHDMMAFFARETCGKCPVCVKGCQVLRDGFEPYLTRPPSTEGQEALMLTAKKYRHKGICSFLDTAARVAESLVPLMAPADRPSV